MNQVPCSATPKSAQSPHRVDEFQIHAAASASPLNPAPKSIEVREVRSSLGSCFSLGLSDQADDRKPMARKTSNTSDSTANLGFEAKLWLANGSMSSNQSGEGDIRKAIIEADLVDCMVALPGQLFYSTQIPVCLWFLAKSKAADPKRNLRDRRKQTLFIDARKMGTLIDRVHRELTEADLEKITSTYHPWRGGNVSRGAAENAEKKKPGAAESLRASASPREYSDVPGFSKSATTAEIAAHGYVLTPGRYVGAEEVEDDGEPFEEKMPRLVAELQGQYAESAKLEAAIRANLNGLGYAL